MANVAPPPTYAEPIIVNEYTGKAVFNPIWLNWFVTLTGTVNGAGGTEIQHNALNGLQGGRVDEYYHLTLAEFSNTQRITEFFLDFGTHEVAFT